MGQLQDHTYLTVYTCQNPAMSPVHLNLQFSFEHDENYEPIGQKYVFITE